MKRTNVYIDGYNLFYGLLKGTVWKWLDLLAFTKALLRDDHEILAVNYFTSRVKHNPAKPQMAIHQQKYLEALSTIPLIRIVEGYYNRFRVKMPFAKDPCKSCDKTDGYAIVWKNEEKRSDVNLATAMLVDAFRDAADSFVLISGDSDLAGPLDVIRHQFGKQTLVFNPHDGGKDELKFCSTYYKHIPRDLPVKCQLPYEIEVGTHGRIIRCPEAWRA